MGRPPLGNTRSFTLRLTDAMAERIDRLVGSHKRNQFIRAAILEKLQRDERKGAVAIIT